MAYSVKISMLLSLALLLLAQALFLPAALTAVFALMWLSLFLRRHKSKMAVPKRWTLALTLTALASIYFSYRSFVGVEAGVAVLSIFLFAKALESKDQRDMLILFNFALFVAASSFLFSQSFAMAVMVLLCLISAFIGLYRLQTSHFETGQADSWQSIRQDAGHVAKLLLYGVPFFILLFLFFPRLPPLWHIPIPENTSVTGISDTMSPGDIAQLSQSTALAFRVIGDIRQLPPRSELYWRAMVLEEYNGSQWSSSYFQHNAVSAAQFSALEKQAKWPYQYLAADPRVQWVMGLEQSIPQTGAYMLGLDGRMTPRRMRMRVEPIALRWAGTAALPAMTSVQQRFSQHLNTRIQHEVDVKAQALATQLWQQSSGNTEQYIRSVLQWYQQQHFVYSLSPGTLGKNRIDEFLFSSRQGFCEHFASSFVMLMRYAGIPARVVVGYQGGQPAPDGKSWEVRQLDAHAWTEVQLDGKWRRFDPTAMIAPQRIDSGMQQYIDSDAADMGESGGFDTRKFALLTKMRIWSDYASYQWQSKVVGYDAESQKNWLNKLGLQSSYSSALVLLSGLIALALLYLGWSLWREKRQLSVWERSLADFDRKLAQQQRRLPAETVQVWMQRLANTVPAEHRAVFLQAADLYMQVMYAERPAAKAELLKLRRLLKTCADVMKLL